MSAFKGTPGPWAVNPVSAQVDAMPSLLPVCQLLWPTDQRSEAETEANARLIAAAPDLLDQHEADMVDLDLLAKAIHAGDPMPELVIRVTDMLNRKLAAIAKATGEQP